MIVQGRSSKYGWVMHKYQTLLISSCLVLVFGFLLAACQRARPMSTETVVITPTPTVTETTTASPTLQVYQPLETPNFVTITPLAYPQPSSQALSTPTEIAYQQPSSQPASPTTVISSPTTNPILLATVIPSPTQTEQATETETLVPSTETETPSTVDQYPGPGENPTETSQYPGPIITNTPLPYPGPETPTQESTRTFGRTITPAPGQRVTVTAFPSLTAFPSPTARSVTPGASPTELPPKPPLSPPLPGSSVTIWHPWGSTESITLQSIVQSFQQIYPDVTFSLLYVPLDDLHDTYQEASYLGSGPDLLFGPAKWGPGFFDEELVTDLSTYVPPDFLSTINPAALSSGQYHQSLISLPLSQHGMVMFRNTSIIDTAPITFEELDAASLEVKHGGIVGSYLERGSLFSAADIVGLGGKLMDENGYPTFNNQFGLEWFDLLTDYDKAGAVTFNTNWDLDMFKRGRVGIIIDGTWNISLLSQILGEGNLAIDPWPTFGTGHLSGWVESDSVFLNTNSTGSDRSAALAFMGYLLDPNVQMHLAEVGHIPSASATTPRDPLIQQAMRAFSSGAAYPINVDQSVLNLYQKELDKAIQSVFMYGANPSDSLKAANDNIVIQLKNMQTSP